jgi:large subunit ribosomal protein L9
MKIILQKDIEHLGKAGEIKIVASGYGRNYLLPSGLATLATKEEIKKIQAEIEAERKKRTEELEKIKEISRKLEKLKIEIPAKTASSKSKKLFGSITSKQIADVINSQGDFAILKHNIEIKEPIRQLGKYEVGVKLGEGVNVKVGVKVVREKKK